MEIPVFNDGRFRLYTIAETTDIYPKEIPEPTDMYIWYQELSIGDRHLLIALRTLSVI